MSSLSAIAPVLPISPKRPIGKEEIQHRGRIRLIECVLAIPSIQAQPFQCGSLVSRAHRPPSSAVVCAAAFNARCGAEQTQTVTRQSYIITIEPIQGSHRITIEPIQGREKSPDLDVGGTGFPPRDECGIGSGQGWSGGGYGWSGGSLGWSGGGNEWPAYLFFGLVLRFLEDQKSKGPYRNERRM